MEDDEDDSEVRADPTFRAALLDAVSKAPAVLPTVSVKDKVWFILFYGLCLCTIIFIGRHFAKLA